MQPDAFYTFIFTATHTFYLLSLEYNAQFPVLFTTVVNFTECLIVYMTFYILYLHRKGDKKATALN